MYNLEKLQSLLKENKIDYSQEKNLANEECLVVPLDIEPKGGAIYIFKDRYEIFQHHGREFVDFNLIIVLNLMNQCCWKEKDICMKNREYYYNTSNCFIMPEYEHHKYTGEIGKITKITIIEE